MHYLFEQSDSLNNPVECFVFDAAEEQFPVRPHWHYFAEFIYMLEGSAEMNTGTDSYILNPGEMMIFHPSSVHSIYAVDMSMPKYAVLKLDISQFTQAPPYTPKFRALFKQAERYGADVFFDTDTAERMECERVFLQCAEEMLQNRYGRDLIVRADIYTLLMNIARVWYEKGLPMDLSDIPADEGIGIESVTEYIDSCISEDLRVADIAKECGMCYSFFAKKFSAYYGMSCKEYIERHRIFKAEELLLFTDYDLNYISQETGFSDCSHLIKSFKKYRGITPKQFRMKKNSKE